MTSSNMDNQLPTIAPGPGPLREIWPLTKNRKSSSACLPCKQAKRKCTGRPAPCKACETTGGTCIFNEQLDLRRKIAAKKTAGELEHYRHMLYNLLECLCTANDERVQQILATIREGGDVDKNIDDLTKSFLLEGSPVEAPTVDASDASSEYQRSLDGNIVLNEQRPVNSLLRITVDKLCDNPLFQVPCKPWTTVTDDDQLVSSLISLYFTWDHPLMQVVDQEMFLRDMGAGGMSSEFCSPVLVNSILAVASTYSDYPEVYAVPSDLASRGQDFSKEAEEGWKAEEGRPSLANIQALALMSHSLKLRGKDNASWLLLRQAVQLGQDIGMFKPSRARHSQWDQMPEHVKRASARTAWSIFILNSQMSMEYRKTANLGVPRLSLDEMDDLERDTFWIPYHPRSNYMGHPKKPALLPYVMAGLAGLTEFVLEIQNLFFDKALDMSIHDVWAEADRLHSRLEAFLGDTAILEDQPVPQLLFLHIKCHQIILLLLGFLLELRDFESLLGPSAIEQVKLRRVHSAKQVAQCLQLYRRHYELPQTPSLMFGPAKSSALTLLPFLNDESTSIVFNELYKVLLSFGGRFPAAREAIFEINSYSLSSKNSSPFENAATVDRQDSDSSS
ncbi:fungal-specific transcription factor domain-containing protein [Aspergillus cavernicola]|uniref:Fungal-specific transcription factor domain-containing protein n=1 Tax=Aspergillus cavernicola TaxID=176166 RepID=A0ABR4J302_9EURO